MLCPHDKSALKSKVLEGDVQVDACETCLGVFLDEDELVRLENEAAARHEFESLSKTDYSARAYNVAKRMSAPPILCPKCAMQMEKSEYGYFSGVVVDTCIHCHSVWLDHGELAQIQKFFEEMKIEALPLPKRLFATIAMMIREKRKSLH